MATLQRIRNHSVALLVIVGFAMAAFIVGDLITSSSSIMQSRRDKVVTINGKKVTYEEFESTRQRKQDFYKALQGRELDAQTTQQLGQMVYTEFVSKALLNEEFDALGLAVTKEEINELIQGQHTSPILSQMFGEQTPQVVGYFVNLITNDGFEQAQQQNPFFSLDNWLEIESQVAQNRKIEKLNALVANAVKPNKLEAKDNYEGDNTECTFAYVKQYASSIPDSVITVTKDDVAKYYESTRRNYKLNAERRNVSYIGVELHPSEQDMAEAEADIKALRDEFATTTEIADFVNGNSDAPYTDAFYPVKGYGESLRTFVEQNGVGAILEPHRENGNYYMMARIMEKTTAPDSTEFAVVFVQSATEADSIYKVLADAKDVNAALASYNQQQKFIGWMPDHQLLQNFGNDVRDKVRSTEKGKVFRYDLNDKMHAVGRVTGRTAPTALAKVAIYATEVFPSTRTRGEEYGKLNRFLTAHKTIKQMQDSARANGFMMMPTTLYTTSYAIGNIQDARRAVQYAFQNKKGDVSDIFESGDNLLVVAITGDVESGYISLSDSAFFKQLAEYNVKPLKKIEKLSEKFDKVIDKSLAGYVAAFPGASIDTAKFVNFNVNSVLGLGVEPRIFEAALKANDGDFLTVEGKNAVVAMQVLNHKNKGLEYDEATRLDNVSHGREYQLAANAAMQVLQNAATIEDNRINFY